MERTIDGIDYIAKSEVLRIIDEHLTEARTMADNSALPSEFQYGWDCRSTAIQALRGELANPQER